MPNYRRAVLPGGTFFFTVVTASRSRILSTSNAQRFLRQAFRETQDRLPFSIDAVVVLPDHLHTIWTLPPDDHDFSTRWALLKKTFTKLWLSSAGEEQPVGISKTRERRHGVWQRRFWEHAIRDDRDFERHCDYIHYNPVKHGLASCPHAWATSSFHRYVRAGVYDVAWCCACNGPGSRAPAFDDLAGTAVE